MRRTLSIAITVSVIALGFWAESARAQSHGDLGCANCHVPHNALSAGDPNSSGPLWKPEVSGDPVVGAAYFTLYSSPTFDALGTDIGQPDGASKFCLGCHDGTYGSVTAEHTFGDGQSMTLAGSHPISFTYSSSLASSPNLKTPGSLRDPVTSPSGLTSGGTIASDLLDGNGKMQCTSCHDIHSHGIGPNHLRYDYESDGGVTMCRTCHNK
ncbi:MAG: hypothetical protein BIFFINMI_02142 [Phycisphaerae bacterium]|nr:hypothetical protein [Phycisphaerae bacterium]